MDGSVTFSFYTFVTNFEEFGDMVASFRNAGFGATVASFAPLDNSAGNRHEPFSVIGKCLAEASTPYVIFCHQDVRAAPSGRVDALTASLRELDRLHANWAVAGNAGVGGNGASVVCITDPNGTVIHFGLPRQVYSLDENFLVVRRASGVRPSTGLNGFHMYATDLCFNAMLRGHTCHVINFHLTHLSAGDTTAAAYPEALARFAAYWNPRLICGVVDLVTTHSLRLSRYRTLRSALANRTVAAAFRTAGIVFVPAESAGPLAWGRLSMSVVVGACRVVAGRIHRALVA